MTYRILAIDPGLHVGYAHMEFGGKVLESGIIQCSMFPAFLKVLDRTDLVTVVAEDYRVYRSHAEKHTGSKVEAVQVLGMLDLYCSMYDLRFIKQQPYHFKLGAKYLGAVLPKGHLNDELSAWYHGVSYLKSIDQFQTQLEQEMQHKTWLKD